ncbi:hypothetical protein BD410DRAFT_809529 [Rickenella mellea]|uniref:Uncharacterized protein n=1 Tax=Rickenella mellea TaxID=50990 RepID=A0A4Y7PJU1_9AGAM|nr:hypothetical protein BD410DRAFT_809529 [Rickenella mellea]
MRRTRVFVRAGGRSRKADWSEHNEREYEEITEEDVCGCEGGSTLRSRSRERHRKREEIPRRSALSTYGVGEPSTGWIELRRDGSVPRFLKFICQFRETAWYLEAFDEPFMNEMSARDSEFVILIPEDVQSQHGTLCILGDMVRQSTPIRAAVNDEGSQALSHVID